MLRFGTESFREVYEISGKNSSKQIFDQAVLGSVIYARMPLSDEILNSIDIKHQFRPYIVIYRNNESIFCYRCSSVNHTTKYKVHVSKRELYKKIRFCRSVVNL